MYTIVLWVIEKLWGNKMQLKTGKSMASNTLNDAAMSIPTSFTSKILGKDIEIAKGNCPDSFSGSSIAEMWNQPHPLIHTWLLLSSISICFLSALFFIFP